MGFNVATNTTRDKISGYFTELAKKENKLLLQEIENQINSSGDEQNQYQLENQIKSLKILKVH
ncbi:hypothetical protein [Borrelia hermsii]|uniref:hypothetical protein n=1 Tax=Borrelia hermsii TaxID=140 RepID=UPI00046CB7FB|nr:hypothetical protein [Borrelia hermsii]